jgi:exopolysaccharide biosynthesis polyprenyl glycosylphosphotransferase
MSVMEPSLQRAAFHAAMADSEVTEAGRGEHAVSAVVLGTLLIDVLVVTAAFLLAYWVRFIVPDDEASALGIQEYARTGALVGVATVLLFSLHGIYDHRRRLPWPSRLHVVVSAISTALVLAVTISYALGDQRFSRLWFGAGWAFAALGLLAWRTVAQRIVAAARTAVLPANRAVIVGANALGQQVAHELAACFEIVGYVDNGSDLAGPNEQSELPLLGPIAHLPRVVQEMAVDELIITLPSDRREQVATLIARGFRRRVDVKVLPDLGEIMPNSFDLHHIGGRPYLGFSPVAHVNWLKRLTDLSLTAAGLLAIWPLLLVIAIAIKLDSPGPVLYRQQRVGKDGRLFSMLKFRSMFRDADRRRDALVAANEATGPLFKMRNDPRVTRVGRILRRSSLDELPQLFNVLQGEMSLVGPRPPLPSEVEKYESWQLGRLRAVPGMTGLWQVSGRSDVSFHEMVRLDLHYIRNWSLSLDIEILCQTLPAVLGNRGAY